MPTATAPTRGWYTFWWYYKNTNGGWTQYYTDTMASAKNWDLTENTTLYAKWTASSPTANWATVVSVGDKYRAKASSTYAWGPYSTDESWTSVSGTYGANSISVSWENITWKSWSSYPAFQACVAMWTWWRLPTIAELRTLYNNPWKSGLSLASFRYWSSTEFNSFNARRLYMNNGNVDNTGKSNYVYVVCVYQ
jgi:hypothetical protein